MFYPALIMIAMCCWMHGLLLCRPELRRVLAWAAIVVWGWSTIYYLMWGHGGEKLPLHVCDVMGVVAICGLWKPSRHASALLYFVGYGLCTQAFFTPVIDEDASWLRKFLFWGTHGMIVLAATLALIDGFRPGWRAFRMAWLGMLLYACLMVPLDVITGWNYGYVGPILNENETKTILGHLPPWPGRLVLMALLVTGLFSVLWLPWALFSQNHEKPPAV